MTRPYLPFLIFLLLFLSTMPFSFDVAISVVPGWHTAIFPPWFIISVIVIIVLLLVTVTYWLLAKRGNKPKPFLFVSHILLTIPLLLYLRFPGILITAPLNKEDQLLQMLELNRKVALTTLALFMLGLVLFIIYFIRTIKINRQTKGYKF